MITTNSRYAIVGYFITSYPTRAHGIIVICSFYYINGLMTAFLMIFRRFPTTFRRFPKNFQNCSEGQKSVPEHFSENFWKFPKIPEDSRRLSRRTRRCFDDTPTNLSTNLRDKLDVSEIIDIFTCEDIISSHVRISYRFYQLVTTRYTTDFYIIKKLSNLLSRLRCRSKNNKD